MGKFTVNKNGSEVKREDEQPLIPEEKKEFVVENLVNKKEEAEKRSNKAVKSKVDTSTLLGKDKSDEVRPKVTEDGRPIISYSRLREYLICPRRYELKTKYGWKPKKATQKTMQGGLVFEAAVLGDKNGILKTIQGNAHKHTLDQAKAFNEHGVFGIGESYVFIDYNHEFFYTRGEIDWIGDVTIQGRVERVIADLKYTDRIDYIWQDFKVKEDALQVIIYSYMHWKKTGEVLNGVYVIVESTYDEPVFQIRRVVITEETYAWLERLLLQVALEATKLTNADKKNCLGGKGQARCYWLKWCDAGRNLLGGVQFVDLDDLPSKMVKGERF